MSLLQSGRHHRASTRPAPDRRRRLGTRRFHDFRASQPQPGRHRRVPAGRLDAEPGRRHQHRARAVPGAHPVPLRPPRRLLGRRALRPAHHGRARVQERRAAPAPGRARRTSRRPRSPPSAVGGKVSLRTAARGADPGRARRRSRRDDRRRRARPTARATSCSAAAASRGARPPPTAPATTVVVHRRGRASTTTSSSATPSLAAAAAPLRALAAHGTRFEDCWTRSRDWPVTEYQMLTGGYPVAPFVAAAEDDPDQTFPPGAGPPGHAAAGGPRRQSGRLRRPGARRPSSPATACSTRPRARGLTTALLGDRRLSRSCTSTRRRSTADAAAPAASLGAQLGALAAANPGGLLAVVALGGPRTANRHEQPAPRASSRRWRPLSRTLAARRAERARDRHQPRRDDHRRSRIRLLRAGHRRATSRSFLSARACAPASSAASRRRPPTSPPPILYGARARRRLDRRRARDLGHRDPGRRRPAADPRCRDARVMPSCARFSIRGINRPDGRTRTAAARVNDTPTLDFERPVVELERKIDELIRVSGGASELRPQIALLETRARELQQKIFAELTPWQKVQLSRHPARPYTLDYIERLVERLHRAARRPPLRRRSGDRRRLRPVRRHAGPGPRPPEGAQHEGEGAAQLRPAEARGVPQGAAPDGAGGPHAAPDHLPHRHPGGLSRASTPRSAARPRRSPRTSR